MFLIPDSTSLFANATIALQYELGIELLGFFLPLCRLIFFSITYEDDNCVKSKYFKLFLIVSKVSQTNLVIEASPMMAGHNNWPLIINLGNSIIGVAVLAMPFCFKQCGILLGMLTLLFCTWLTLSSCSLLMRAGIISRRRSYEFLAYHTHGATGKFVSEIGMIGMQMGTLIAQIVVIGDLGPAIVSKLLGIENTNNLRTLLVVFLCLCVGLPLGFLKDIRTVSRGSTICITFYCVFVFYILLMSIPNLWTGSWYFKVNFWRPQGLFQCLPILSFSFGCQTQLFIVYEELPEPSLKAVSGVISSAVNLCAVAYLLVGFFGYITFHTFDVPGDILAVFPSNVIADGMKLCFVFSIVITFPVIIFPCRASLYTLLFAKKTKLHDDSLEGGSYIPENLFKGITVVIMTTSMIIGILIPNVEFILGMNGAIMGCLICYIFPAMFFIKVTGAKSEGKTIAQLVLVLGVSILLVSTYATLSSQDKGHTDIEQPLPIVDQPHGIDMNAVEQHLRHQEPIANEGPVVKREEQGIENRKEPPIPDPPSNEDEGKPPVKVDTIQRKKNASAVKIKTVDMQPQKDTEEKEKQKEAELKAKEKEMEEAHKVKVLELEEKEKKQEEILDKLEKHKQDQEKLLKEQKAVLQQLNDHKEKDISKDEAVENKVLKINEDDKDEIVKQQQQLLNQQQQINEQQQELIQQQQQQLNQQLLKDQQKLKEVTVKPKNQALNPLQPVLNENAQPQALNAQPQALNAQPQGLNPKQPVLQGLNPQQQVLNAQESVLNAQGQDVKKPVVMETIFKNAIDDSLNSEHKKVVAPAA